MFEKNCWNKHQKKYYVPAIVVVTVVPTMIVGTAVQTKVVGITPKDMFVPTIIVGTVVPYDCWNSCSNNHCLNGILLEILPPDLHFL